MKNFFKKIYALRWKILNYAIILIFIYQVIYSIYVFMQVVPPGWPPTMSLGARVNDPAVTMDILTKRRMYAIELWLSAGALIVYVGIVYGKKLGQKISEALKDEKEALVKEIEKRD